VTAFFVRDKVSPHKSEAVITDFKLSWQLIVDINWVLGILHCVDMGDVTEVSEVRAVSIFSMEVCQLVSCCAHTAFCFKRKGERGVGIDALFRPVGTADREYSAHGPSEIIRGVSYIL
jgi:hypothetical protein